MCDHNGKHKCEKTVFYCLLTAATWFSCRVHTPLSFCLFSKPLHPAHHYRYRFCCTHWSVWNALNLSLLIIRIVTHTTNPILSLILSHFTRVTTAWCIYVYLSVSIHIFLSTPIILEGFVLIYCKLICSASRGCKTFLCWLFNLISSILILTALSIVTQQHKGGSSVAAYKRKHSKNAHAYIYLRFPFIRFVSISYSLTSSYSGVSEIIILDSLCCGGSQQFDVG